MTDSNNGMESMRVATRTLMDKIKRGKPNQKIITPSVGRTFENIINQQCMMEWRVGYKSVAIKILNYQTFNTVEFIPPKIERTFIKRFIEGKETLDGFLHRRPIIEIRISPRVFHGIKHEDDVYQFFKYAVSYYAEGINRASEQLMHEILRLNGNMKYLIANTNLRGLVEFPLTMLFRFNDVQIFNYKNTFKIDKSDIRSLNQFVKNIATRYRAPERERGQIIRDVKDLVKQLNESFTYDQSCTYLPEAVETLMSGGYHKDLLKYEHLLVESVLDHTKPVSPQVKYYREFFGVKKLKKIPKDLVPYIQIETEAIETANDKMMLASYTLSKIEIVEWYIELLSTTDERSRKYVVPHTKPYLETIRTQLLICYKNIMKVKIERNKPLIDIDYPKGYEG